MERRALVRKLAAALLIFAAAAGPVFLYDRLVARHLLQHRPSAQEIADGFHHLWYHSGATWQKNRWLGVPAQQNPNDVWIIQEIMFETKPDFVIETGTLFGGGAILWATLLEQTNPAGRVITIDVQDRVDEEHLPPIARRKVDFLLGMSTAPEIVAEVKRRVAGKRVLVILDSDHSMQNVLAELDIYAPLVPVGGYVIAQDTDVNGHPVLPRFGPGPMEAVDEFLKRDKRFESDRSRERLIFTMHPKGFLRRISL
jgi:cephalosporin hydroxylase